VGVSLPTVIGWRDRYWRGGIKALEDEPRSGRNPFSWTRDADELLARIRPSEN
jgi:transposase